MSNDICPAVSQADREPSTKLRVELATRITTQRIHYRSGNEEAAAESVAKLFPTVRELLVIHWQAKAFEWVALRLLNETVRPYTARWHGWIVEEKFCSEQTRRVFRAELQTLQKELGIYLMAFATLEEGKTPELKPEDSEREREETASLGTESLRAGISDQVAFSGTISAREINAVERKEILARRAIFGRAPLEHARTPLENATALAFSGGGIRSATFCLGVTQVLARKGMLEQFDYLSTVSGGGYLGSFLSCALGTQPETKSATDIPSTNEANATQPAMEQANPLTTEEAKEKAEGARAKIDDAFRPQSRRESGLIRHLRNNSKYLLNGGISARFEMVGLVMSGILSNLLLVLPIPLGCVLVVFYADSLAHFWGDAMHPLTRPIPVRIDPAFRALLVPTAILGFLWILLPLVQLINHGKRPGSPGAAIRRWWEKATLALAVVTGVAGVVFLIPALFWGYAMLSSKLPQWSNAFLPLLSSLSGATTVILGVLTTVIGSHRKRLRAILAKLFIVSGPVFILSIFLWVGNYIGLGVVPDPIAYLKEWWEEPVAITTFVTVGLTIWGWFFVNINTLAPHRYYRARLCECYLARRLPQNESEVGRLQKAAGEWSQGRTAALNYLPLSELGTTHAAPYHLLNTTVNLPSSDNKELRGRNGDFFVVSKYFCGSPIVGFARTPGVEKTDPHFDLGTAMAVSGAAASSNMGWQTLPHFRFLMTLFNVRMGYWLRWPPEKALHRFVAGAGPWYLFREMLGWADERCRFLNLSDGGHIENLAVYELLRRKCKFIVCVDAGLEPKMECADLMRLQRYAAIDLGIHMQIKVSDLELVNGLSRSYAVLILIDYDPPLNESEANERDWSKAELGWMLYLKLAVTGTEPGYVLDYRRTNPDFPHQSTGDQIYDEAQFEAYRQLGECAMESLFREELMGDTAPNDMKAWFQKLADNLLPDNHPLFQYLPVEPHAAEPLPGKT